MDDQKFDVAFGGVIDSRKKPQQEEVRKDGHGESNPNIGDSPDHTGSSGNGGSNPGINNTGDDTTISPDW